MKSNGIALIGLGAISDKYRSGLEDSSIFELVAICDKKEDLLQNNKYVVDNKYVDYKKMVEDKLKLGLNTVIIATPPKTHYEIAKYCLEHGINVLIEKPATVNFEQLEDLYQTATKFGSKFLVMFHWMYGSEIVYLHKHIDEYIQRHGEIIEVKAIVNDPYSDCCGHILPSRVGLEGTWLDCGINCISMIERIIPMHKKTPISVESQIDSNNGLPYYTKHNLIINDIISTEIIVDWREKKNFKRTSLTFSDGAEMFIDHTDQIIFLAENQKEKQNLQTIKNYLFDFHDDQHINMPEELPTDLKPICDFNNLNHVDRLHTHYYNFFTMREIDVTDTIGKTSSANNIESIDDFYAEANSMKDSLKLHRLLFDLNPHEQNAKS